MPRWILKAILQGAFSQLPAPQRWNRFFQQRVTRSLALTDEFFQMKWRVSQRHVEAYRQHRRAGSPAELPVAIELGTGWYPIAAIGLVLNGVGKVVSVDIQDLLHRDRVIAALERCDALLDRGAIEPLLPEQRGRLRDALARASGRDAREILALLGIESVVADARKIPLTSGGVDLFVSNNTLEHIPREVIADIFREFGRLAAPGAVMSHHIDLSDHYANFDRSVSVFNFLKYSARTWRWFNSSLHYQNRLRVNDFRDLHAAGGWEVVREESTRGDPGVLRALRLAPYFAGYREEDLLVHRTWMVSMCPRSPVRNEPLMHGLAESSGSSK
ncbi:MAG: methyltransferase domain-containing protein [Polyangiaceae bacterium]|nr:methyltransferase domain-containing protein [Polyangiaceae bacterium]